MEGATEVRPPWFRFTRSQAEPTSQAQTNDLELMTVELECCAQRHSQCCPSLIEGRPARQQLRRPKGRRGLSRHRGRLWAHVNSCTHRPTSACVGLLLQARSQASRAPLAGRTGRRSRSWLQGSSASPCGPSAPGPDKGSGRRKRPWLRRAVQHIQCFLTR